ncbi:MAG: hypothetical protein Ct9H300mP12_12470 [Acidimicrobiales bacterium]|nr:MAG: hypothetical protein Ct9H300mP12_12470 [Acidimicrobiales bacterium]
MTSVFVRSSPTRRATRCDGEPSTRSCGPTLGSTTRTSRRHCPTGRLSKRFQHILFSKIVPNCKKLGLLDHRDGWLRERFQEMNIIQFEDWENTAEALNLEGRVDDSQTPTSFDPDALEGVEVIDDPIQAS